MNLWKIYNLTMCYQISEGDFKNCNHCWKLIKNIAVIESEGKNYEVWSQCVQKLLKLDGSDYWKNIEIEKQIRLYFSILSLLKKATKVKYGEYGDNSLWCIHYWQNKTKIFKVNEFLKYKTDIWESVGDKYCLNDLIK